MRFDLISNKNTTTKDKIVHLLSYDWPLSIRKIYLFLKKRYGCKTTYQAVYKAVKEMLESRVLDSTKEGYKLNLLWIKEIHDQTEIIRVNYFSEQHATIFEKKARDIESIRVFIFKTWFDVEKYLYYLQKNYLLKTTEKQVICTHHAHEWRPLFYLRAEYNWINKLHKSGHKVFTLCSGNSVVDKWSAKFYTALKSNIKLDVKCAETSEIVVFGDFIAQIYLPLELRDALDKELSNLSHISDLDYARLITKIFEKDSEIKVVINKDAALASQLKNQTLSKFKTY